MKFPTEVQAVIDRAATITEAENHELAKVWTETWTEARRAAYDEALDKVWDELTLADAWDEAEWAINSGHFYGVKLATQYAARDAIIAYLAGDEITPELRNRLAGPWEQVMA